MPSSSASPTSGTVRLLRVLLAASLVVPVLLYAGAAWEERQVLLHEAAGRVDKTAEVLEQHAASAFHAYELIFARVDEHLRAVPDETEAGRHAYLAGIDHELKEVGSLFLLDGSGKVTAHSRYYPVPASDASDRDYFRILAAANGPAARVDPTLDESGLAVGIPVSGRFSGTPKLNIARAVVGADGRFAGAIAISVSQEYFETFHRTLSTSPSDSMALIRADGATLARSPALTPEQIQAAQAAGNSRRVLDRLAGGIATFTSPLDHVERIVSYRKLAAYPIYVGYGLGTAAVLAPWRFHLAIYGLVAAIAGLALFCVTWLALRAAQEEAAVRASLVAEMGRREAAEAALRQSQKMEAVGQLTGGVAHDFNNLLAAVLGNLELLAKRLPDEPRLRRYLEGALEGARRGAGLTQRLLAFSRRQELEFEAVAVADLVGGMTDLFERSLGPTTAIEAHFPTRLPPARADANQLEAALLNLVVNARDAMPGGGRIVISGREETFGVDRPLDVAAGRYVVLSVEDAGEGMSADTIARATEPFFTTKAVGKGTGLGLAMVHGLAAQSGGTLRIESELGRGTRVEVWLPAAEEDAAPPAPPLPAMPRTSRSYRVLLVDDDALVRAGTAAMLEDLGHRVVEAGSGRDALEELRREAAIDVMVTDQVMPGMLGSALAAQARILRADLPIVLASGYAESSGADAERLPRLAKPFTQGALAQAIEDAVLGTGATTVVPPQRRTEGRCAS